jgi:DNA polymerase III epsilon subunit-like protein
MWPLSIAAFLPLVVPGLVAVGLTLLGHRWAAQGRPSGAVDVAALAVASLMAALNVVVAVTTGSLFVVVGCSLLAAVGVVLERRRARGWSPAPTPPPPSPPSPPSPPAPPALEAPPAPESTAVTASPAVAPAPLTPADRSSPPHPKPSSPAISGHGGLHRLTDGARLVVVDTETTGLFNRDRVIEVATIELDADGRVVDQWETLIAAGRDVGPTSIHRISPDMLLDAPTFKAIAGQLADRLNGAVLAGHNVQFDTRMLANEFERAGIAFDPGTTIDTKTAAGGSLDDACGRHGVELDGHHRASADAMATARLLIAVAGKCAPGRAARLDGYATTRALPLTREQVSTKEPKPVERPAPPLAVKDGAAAYHELLG